MGMQGDLSDQEFNSFGRGRERMRLDLSLYVVADRDLSRGRGREGDEELVVQAREARDLPQCR